MVSFFKLFVWLVLAVVVSAGPCVAYAESRIIFNYNDKLKIDEVIAIVGIDELMVAPGDNCDQRIADIVIDEVVYDGASDMVAGFRAKKPAPNEWYGIFRIDTEALYKPIPNVGRHDPLKLIKNGANLIVIYQVCGSGGYVFVRDIFKKTAINNP